MFRNTFLVVCALLLASCDAIPNHSMDLDQDENFEFDMTAWDVPHTKISMLLPDGWVTEYSQGDITIASTDKNLFFNPSEPFEGVLIHMFVSDGPRAVGPSFDVMKLAEDFVADQPNVIQRPNLQEQDRRQIVTTLYQNEDSRGTLITYLAGFVLEEQQLTVFLAATPADSELLFLPILDEMLHSIQIASPL